MYKPFLDFLFWNQDVRAKRSLSDSQINMLTEHIKNMHVSDLGVIIKSLYEDNYNLDIIHPKCKFSFIHLCVRYTTLNNQQQALKILNILLNANINLNRYAEDSIHTTPLHTAARRGLPLIVLWLLENGADVDAKDIKQKTALDYIQTNNDRNKGTRRLIEVENILIDFSEKNKCTT